MKFKIKKKYLWEVLKLNKIVSEEGKIVIDNNGWSIVMSDTCHVMMGVFRLHKSAFEEYPAEILFECDNIYSMKYLLAPRIGGEY